MTEPLNFEKVEKIGIWIPVTAEEVAEANHISKAMAIALGFEPDPRTAEQREIDRRNWDEETARLRAETAAEHAANLAAADGFRRAILEFHGPSYYGGDDRYARCDGCDGDGYEMEPPGWPCRTYELATGWETQ